MPLQSFLSMQQHIESFFFAVRKFEYRRFDIEIMERCQYADCIMRACCGIPDGPLVFCIDHVQDGMIRKSFRARCDVAACAHPPLYNFPWENEGRFCHLHRYFDMPGPNRPISRRKLLQFESSGMQSHSCAISGCPKRAIYGYPSQLGKWYCKDHKEPGMGMAVQYPNLSCV